MHIGVIDAVENRIKRRAEAVPGALAQATSDHVAQGCRDRRLERVRLVAQDRRHHLAGGAAPERPSARQHLVHHAAEGEQVRASVRGPSTHLLGRHVGGGPHRHPLVRESRVKAPLSRPRFGQPGEAEVEQLDHTVRGEKQVGGLEVAVDHTLAVRRVEAVRDLKAEVECSPPRQCARRQELAKVAALEQLHDRIRPPALSPEVIDRHDVGVAQAGNGAGLPLEALTPRRLRGDVLRQHLDRHRALEHGVAGTPDLAAIRSRQEVTRRFGLFYK